MSSSYNDPYPRPEAKPYGNEAVFNAEPYSTPGSPPPPAKKSGCGCMGCGLGCLGVLLIGLIAVGIGTWYFVKKIPDMARDGIAKAVEQSEMTPDDKRMVMQQVDRLVDGYKEGKVDFETLGRFGEKLMQSPLMDLLIVAAAKEQYIDKSGLSEEEKTAAMRTLRRFTRAAIDGKIDEEQVDGAMNHISTEMPNGGRQLKQTLSDEELRAFLAECKKLADEAMIPDEDVRVDVGAELKKLVDDALGESPQDAVAPPVAVPSAESPDPSAPPTQPPAEAPPADAPAENASSAAEAPDPNAAK